MAPIPPIAFLGVSYKARSTIHGPAHTWNHDILGLNQNIFSFIFPFNFKGINLLFAIYDLATLGTSTIKFVDPSNKEIFEIKIEPKIRTPPQNPESVLFNLQTNKLLPCWSVLLYPLNFDAIINDPQNLRVFLEMDGTQLPLGALNVDYGKMPPLRSPEFMEELRINPRREKTVVVDIGCKKCKSHLRAYAAIEKNNESNDTVWFEDLPDTYICNCGQTTHQLKYIRENLHALLLQSDIPKPTSFLGESYNIQGLRKVIAQFKSLVQSKPPEQEIQKFIQENSLVLQLFSPRKVYHKKMMLTEHEIDFGVLTAKKELLLIEIERPDCPILKKDGGMKSEMVHAIKQVNDWLHLIKKERSAVLRAFDLKTDEVTNIRGVVILGIDEMCNSEHLMKLKSLDLGEITFYTYTDLINSMADLLNNLQDS